jgi:dolichyl-diphosphooligosaccharide--protein glycosyltransferase
VPIISSCWFHIFVLISDGYQISAIANRTTLADGNTWNHEHIALLGKALTADIKVGYEIARHLADYVLIWGGGGGDDLAKSPHLARIANSVYRDHCPNDPTCRAFGVVDRQGTPSPMMRRSLLFNLHSNIIRPDVNVSSDMFVEVYRSKYGKVRIYEIIGVSQESKQWVEENRVCDYPGSWFCPGQYPPALKPFIDAKKDFRQLEDFNRGEHDIEYQKRYFEDLHNPETARKRALEQQEYRESRKESEMSDFDIAQQEALKQQLYSRWEDSEAA